MISISWLIFSLFFWDITFSHLNNVKNIYISFCGNVIAGNLLSLIYSFLFLFPLSPTLYCFSFKRNPLLKLNYLILSENTLLLKVLNKYLRVAKYNLYFLYAFSVIFFIIIILLEPFNIEFINEFLNSNYNLDFNKLYEVDTSRYQVTLSKFLQIVYFASVDSINLFYSILMIPLIFCIKSFPILIFSIISTCSYLLLKGKIFKDEKIEIRLEDDKYESITINETNPISSKNYDLLLKGVKSKEYLDQIIEKIRELKTVRSK